MTFAEMFVDDAEPLRNPDQGAGTSVLERPETKESPVRDDGGDAAGHDKRNRQHLHPHAPEIPHQFPIEYGHHQLTSAGVMR